MCGSSPLAEAVTRSTGTGPVWPVLIAISLCHMVNDILQSLLSAIYPLLKAEFALSYAQIGLMTFAFQVTASLLQPVVGVVTDRRPMPKSLAVGMLSRFAGAARELKGALLVNPYDIEGTANALARALSMPASERRERWQIMMDFLLEHDVSRWCTDFLKDLTD